MSPIANSVFLTLLFVLNYVDAMFTLVWVRLGLASEANPLMAEIIDNPLLFVSVKVTMVTLCCVLLFRHRHRTSAKVAAILGAVVYVGILVIHTIFVVRVLELPPDVYNYILDKV